MIDYAKVAFEIDRMVNQLRDELRRAMVSHELTTSFDAAAKRSVKTALEAIGKRIDDLDFVKRWNVYDGTLTYDRFAEIGKVLHEEIAYNVKGVIGTWGFGEMLDYVWEESKQDVKEGAEKVADAAKTGLFGGVGILIVVLVLVLVIKLR